MPRAPGRRGPNGPVHSSPQVDAFRRPPGEPYLVAMVWLDTSPALEGRQVGLARRGARPHFAAGTGHPVQPVPQDNRRKEWRSGVVATPGSAACLSRRPLPSARPPHLGCHRTPLASGEVAEGNPLPVDPVLEVSAGQTSQIPPSRALCGTRLDSTRTRSDTRTCRREVRSFVTGKLPPPGHVLDLPTFIVGYLAVPGRWDCKKSPLTCDKARHG